MTIDDLFELFVTHLVKTTLLASSSPDALGFLDDAWNDDDIVFGASW
jgi:hypothetical protein